MVSRYCAARLFFVPGQQSNVAFFPLYPNLIRVVHYLVPLSGDAGWLLVGITVSNAALVVALIYLYQLVRLDFDQSTAARTVLYLCVFPTTLFLSAVYSESLFLALIVSAFYYARSGRWLVVGRHISGRCTVQIARSLTHCFSGLRIFIPERNFNGSG